MLKRLQSWLGLTPYFSELDLFLSKLNHPKRLLTNAEQKEIQKHQRIAKARDTAVSRPAQKTALWNGF